VLVTLMLVATVAILALQQKQVPAEIAGPLGASSTWLYVRTIASQAVNNANGSGPEPMAGDNQL